MSDAEQENRGGQRSRWDMIASLLGATVPEEPTAPSADVAESDATASPAAPPEAAAPPTRAKQRRARPAPRPGNWNALCGELGIETPSVPDRSPESKPAATALPDVEPPASDAVLPAPVNELESDRRAPFLSFEPDAELGADNTTDPASGVAPCTRFEGDADTDDDARDSDARDSDARDSDARDSDARDSDARDSDARDSDARDSDARDSGTDRQVTQPELSGESTGHRRRRRGRRRRGSAEREVATDGEALRSSRDEVDDVTDNAVADEADEEVPLVADAEADRDDTDQGALPERGRRSRRRRRRPTRREPEPMDEDNASRAADVDELDADVEDDVDADLDDEIDADLDDEMETDVDDDDMDADDAEGDRMREPRGARAGRGEGASRGKHKKIPTWEEAISVIVAVNLEVRRRDDSGKNRPRGPRRRGRGSSGRT